MPTPLEILLSHCLALVNSKKADGFFWPNEFGPAAPFGTNGDGFSCYTLPMGHLYLRVGVFRAYGYANEDDFKADCITGTLHANTVKGALTLGPSRAHSPQAPAVHLFPKGCYGRMIFNASDDTEAIEIQKSLSEFFPEASIRICRGAISAMLAGAPPFSAIPKGYKALSKEGRMSFFFQVSLFLITVMLIALSWRFPHLSRLLIAGAIVVTLVFIVTLPRVITGNTKNTPS